MYKAILCDDDELIAMGLATFIPWEELGIELCGTFNDGLSAKKAVEEIKPDIIVSDIRMPFVDGLELTKFAKEIISDVKVILISGYNDFQFAQQAIKLGIMDYLLKPVKEEDLIELLKKAVREISEKQVQDELYTKGAVSLRREQLQCMVFEGKEIFEERFGSEEYLKLNQDYYSVSVLVIDNFDQILRSRSNEEIQDIVLFFRDCVERYALDYEVIDQRLEEFTGYISAPEAEMIPKMRKKNVTQLRDAFRVIYPDISITCASSTVDHGAASLKKGYEEAIIALQERFVSPGGSDIVYDKQRQSEDSMEISQMVEVFKLSSLISQGNRSLVEHELDGLKGRLLKVGAQSLFYMKLVTGEIFTGLVKNLQQCNINLNELDIDLVEECQKITDAQNLDTAIFSLQEMILRIMDAIDKNRDMEKMKTMTQACDYIESHYGDHLLTIEAVANHVHLSPSYFSVVFKKEMGVSFTDYLISLRIRKSQELMRFTSMKINEIAEQVGYDTAQYYSTAFKKEVGMSPSDYKRKVEEGDI